MADNIKVMIVDDSALVRQVVSQALAREPGIEVVATASDPVFALDKLKTLWPASSSSTSKCRAWTASPF